MKYYYLKFKSKEDVLKSILEDYDDLYEGYRRSFLDNFGYGTTLKVYIDEDRWYMNPSGMPFGYKYNADKYFVERIYSEKEYQFITEMKEIIEE